MEQQQQQPPKDTRTATQKISDLEQGLTQMYGIADNIANDLKMIKEAIKLLGNKSDAIVKATASGQAMSDELISQIMVDNNVQELKNKVTDLIAQGFLEAQDQATDNSFVVGREENNDGKVVNPRLQFAVAALQKQEYRDLIKAAKVGDSILLQEGKLKFVLLETYAITQPKPAVVPASVIEEAPADAKDVTPQAAAPAAPEATTTTEAPSTPEASDGTAEKA